MQMHKRPCIGPFEMVGRHAGNEECSKCMQAFACAVVSAVGMLRFFKYSCTWEPGYMDGIIAHN